MLVTDRLNMQWPEKHHANFIYRLLNSPAWLQFIGDRGIKNLSDAENYITNKLQAGFSEYGFGMYIMERKSDAECIGVCGLIQRSYLDRPDIGFAVLPEATGKGYTSEAAGAVLAYARQELKPGQIYGITTEDNLASQRVLTKLGLVYQKDIKDEQGEKLMLFSTL
jgi:RimJ/RimL family protein N-acetyltransferase